jgi:hyperosmotically inducible protein
MIVVMKLPLILCLTALASAQQPAPKMVDPVMERTVLRMARDIQRAVLNLPTYGVFDSITFGIKGYTVILRGVVSRPIVKADAERLTQKVEGVTAVENKIEVLPLSPNDDSIRAQAYARIYGHQVLSRYSSNRGSPQFFSLGRAAGGITNDPPVGWHAIHLIVRNGTLRLEGVVDSTMDRTIAELQANQTSAFVVENNLQVANQDEQKAIAPKK